MRLSTTLFSSLLFAFSFAGVSAQENKAYVVYEAPASMEDGEAIRAIRSSGAANEVVALINEQFRLSVPLAFIFGAEDGPLFDPEFYEILIPYEFVVEIEDRFEGDNYEETGVSIDDATMDALMHTLLHEFGHAIIAMHDIPVLGREEDAADGLATLLLIEFFENGEEIVITAADLFDLESDDFDTFGEESFWDEHSLDDQRFYTTLGYVYGSDPVKYAHIKTEADFDDARAELYIEEYEQLSDSWFKLLGPYMKN